MVTPLSTVYGKAGAKYPCVLLFSLISRGELINFFSPAIVPAIVLGRIDCKTIKLLLIVNPQNGRNTKNDDERAIIFNNANSPFFYAPRVLSYVLQGT